MFMVSFQHSNKNATNYTTLKTNLKKQWIYLILLMNDKNMKIQ